jgi:hypothetical protein
MQPYINKIVAWGKRSGLEFNSSKTMAVLFTRKMPKDSDYLKKIIINDEQIDFSDEAKYLGVVLDSKLTWNSHIKAKVIKAKRLLFAIKNSIAKTVGPKPSIVRNAFKTLVMPMVSYACHLFADKLNNVTLQKELSRLNRIACLSLGSVPPRTPTATMGILFNLMPLDIEMEKIAIKTYCRIKNKLPRIWDGRPTSGGARVGHLRYWEEKIKKYNIAVNEIDSDQLVMSRTWTRNFEVLTTRDDALDL